MKVISEILDKAAKLSEWIWMRRSSSQGGKKEENGDIFKLFFPLSVHLSVFVIFFLPLIQGSGSRR